VIINLNRRRLVWQLYPSYLLLIVLIGALVGWYVSGELRNFHYQQTATDLQARAALVEQQLPNHLNRVDRAWLTSLVEQLGKRSHTRITIIAKNGVVLADSYEDSAQMDNHGKRPEILEVFAGHPGKSIRFSATLGQSLMYVAIPIIADGELVGSVRTALPLSGIDATLQGIYIKLLSGGLILATLLAPICWWLARKLSRPLELMTTGAQQFSAGNLDVPLAVTGSLETSRLAEAMNLMAIKLADRIESEVEQRSETEAILGCMVEGVIAVDTDERIIRLNQAAAKLFTVSSQLESGRPIQEVIRQAELQRFIRRALNQACAGNTINWCRK